MHCMDCSGHPIDGGGVFVAACFVKDGKQHHGWICELCWLKRLKIRAKLVNLTSGPIYHVPVPGEEFSPLLRYPRVRELQQKPKTRQSFVKG